jgi:hypothetical protein
MTPAENRTDVHAFFGLFRPTAAFVVIIFGALIAFEIFNFSTTDHALTDLLGDLTFAGVLPWSTVLALAFCGIDFAGIARLFTPEQGLEEPKEVWYLFGAWLLAATMNAILTWWGVSMAVSGHTLSSSAIIDPETLNTIVPVFVAVMVWVIRILIIGTLSLAVDRLLHPGAHPQHSPIESMTHPRQNSSARPNGAIPMGARTAGAAGSLNTGGYPARPSTARQATPARPAPAQGARPAPRPNGIADDEPFFPTPAQPEPTYHSIGARPANPTADRFRRS